MSADSNQTSLKDLRLREIRGAIDSADAFRARFLLDELEHTPEEYGDVERRTYEMLLTLTAFPLLRDEDAVALVQFHLLDFYRIGIPFEQGLTDRYIYAGDIENNRQRELLKDAVLKNQEMLGSIKIGEWLQRLDQRLDPNTRTLDQVLKYMLEDQSVASLPSDAQGVLRSFVKTYENLLASPIIGQDDITAYHMALDEPAGVRGSMARTESGQPVKTVRMALLKAMGEYRRLGDQAITNERIRVKSSMEPVRPTLANWLRSYREELGIGFHESVKRGDFLFQSQNGKKLSNDERARLNLILKSVEEDFPLEIDTVHQTIVFPNASDSSMELTQVKSGGAPSGAPRSRVFIQPRGMNFQQSAQSGAEPSPANPVPFQAFQRPVVPVKGPEMSVASQATLKSLFTKSSPEKNISGETLHFSTGHILPAERFATPNPPTPPVTPAKPDSTHAGVPPTPPRPATQSQTQSQPLKQNQPQSATPGVKPAMTPLVRIDRQSQHGPANSPYSIRPLRSRDTPDRSA